MRRPALHIAWHPARATTPFFLAHDQELIEIARREALEPALHDADDDLDEDLIPS